MIENEVSKESNLSDSARSKSPSSRPNRNINISKPRGIIILYRDSLTKHPDHFSSSFLLDPIIHMAEFFSFHGYVAYVVMDNFSEIPHDPNNTDPIDDDEDNNNNRNAAADRQYTTRAGKSNRTEPSLSQEKKIEDYQNLVRYGLAATHLASKRHNDDVPLFLMGHGMGAVLAVAVAMKCQKMLFDGSGLNADSGAIRVSGVVVLSPTLFDVKSRQHYSRGNNIYPSSTSTSWHRRILSGLVSSSSLRINSSTRQTTSPSLLSDESEFRENQNLEGKELSHRKNTTEDEPSFQRELIQQVYQDSTDMILPIHCTLAPPPIEVQGDYDEALVPEDETRTWYDQLSSRDKTWRVYRDHSHSATANSTNTNAQSDLYEDLGCRIERDILSWLERHRRYRTVSKPRSGRRRHSHHTSRRLWSDGRTMESLVPQSRLPSSSLRSVVPNETIGTRRKQMRNFGNVPRSASAPSSLGRHSHRRIHEAESSKTAGGETNKLTTTIPSAPSHTVGPVVHDSTISAPTLDPDQKHEKQNCTEQEQDKIQSNKEMVNTPPETTQASERSHSLEKLPSTFDTTAGESLDKPPATTVPEKQYNNIDELNEDSNDIDERKTTLPRSTKSQSTQRKATTTTTTTTMDYNESFRRLRALAGFDETAYLSQDSAVKLEGYESYEEYDDDATPIKRGDGGLTERPNRRNSEEPRRHSLCTFSWSSRSVDYDDDEDTDSYIRRILGSPIRDARSMPEHGLIW